MRSGIIIVLLFLFQGSLLHSHTIQEFAKENAPADYEKLYLHTDREFYFLGDTLWFAAYLVEGTEHIPVSYSFNLYVDLLNHKGEPVRNQLFLIEGGQADLYRVNDVPHGSVTRRWYDSPMLGLDRRITIYTPPGYEDSKAKYPVLYLLHGAGGDEEAWIALGRTAQIMDKLIASGKAEPMIVVMPNGNVSQQAAPGEGKRGFYKPQFMEMGTMDGSFEASFMDIVDFVEDSYRVKRKKKYRAVAGLSMGGFHSLHISRYYPNVFDYVGLFSAAILPNQNVTSVVYQDIDGSLKQQMDNGYKLYWIGIGKSDFLYNNVKSYTEKLSAMGMPYTYLESEGGHIWKNWRIYLSEFTPLLFK